MDLILWRHAEAKAAEPGADDIERALTAKGERHAERMAAWLGRRITNSTRVLVSPALRCQQTAKALDRKTRTVAALGPLASAEDVLSSAGWPEALDPVLVVSHQPGLGRAIALLLTGVEQAWPMKKGAVWWLRLRPGVEDGRIVLLAVQTPDCL